MEPNVKKLQFVSLDAIDKVVASGTEVITNNGPSGSSYATSDSIVERTIANPYGKRCLVRFRWKTEDSDFTSPQSIVEYAYTVDATAWGGPVSDPIPGTKAAVSIGISATEIKIRTINGHHSNVAYSGTAMSPGPDIYSAIAHVFTVEYALFEVD